MEFTVSGGALYLIIGVFYSAICAVVDPIEERDREANFGPVVTFVIRTLLWPLELFFRVIDFLPTFLI